MKTILSIVRLVSMALAILLAFATSDSLLTFFPDWYYEAISPSAKKQCEGIRAGMTRDEVLELVNRQSEPHSQRITALTLEFSRSDGKCFVVLNADSAGVISASYRETVFERVE